MPFGHNNPENANEPLPSPEDRHLDALMDGGGFSGRMAEIMTTGLDPSRESLQKPSGLQSQRSKQDHRGGRAYPEPSDSEIDPNWHVQPAAFDPETKTEFGENIAFLRGLDRARHIVKAASDPTELHRVLAIQRARDERRKR